MQKRLYLELNTCSCENFEYLTSAIDDSVISCDEIINAADSALKNGSANVVSTVSKKFLKMDCYILQFY